MNESDNKQQIKDALIACGNAADFAESAKELFAAMGYRSSRNINLSCNAEEFIDNPKSEQTRAQQSFCQHTKHITGLFQYTETEINDDSVQELKEGSIDNFMFFAVQLTTGSYSRSQYAEWTRVINKEISAPVIVLFRCTDKTGNTKITFAFIAHRPHKLANQRFVLEKASLLRQINSSNPHRGHLDILNALTLTNRNKWIESKRKVLNFDSLLDAWLDELDTEALNNRFYKNLEQWFTTAIEYVKFPSPSRLNPQEQERYLKEQVMRLINRILFIWFIKEKGLVAEALFEPQQITDCLKDGIKDNGDNYYRAVLQNLFFATLNTEIEKRRFSKANNDDHRNPALYRYEDLITDKKRLLDYFSQTPFVNGGLFECLDDYAGKRQDGKRVDCFTDNSTQRKELSVPNWLFFGTDSTKGLFEILRKYKFVVEENTPIEQEVALDPELLGKVFERLLAHIDRRESGTYYTPRSVVNYMVQEALLAYFANAMNTQANANLENRLQLLLTAETDYETLPPQDKLTRTEIKHFIDATSKLRLLEPAAGSGAFLMGVLTHLTMALLRIDPENDILHKRERERAEFFDDEKIRKDAREIVKKRFSEENQFNNYARKLTIIRDCLFGVDISPAAVQTCRLRFFISLVIEQEVNKRRRNYGIESLPNLEARVVAADTLIKIAPPDLFRSDPQVQKMEKELQQIRQTFFTAKERKEKLKYIKRDEAKRAELSAYLQHNGYQTKDAERIAEWDLYNQTSMADWFDSEWMFGVRDGFDIVIGNPPYIQLRANNGYLSNKYRPFNYSVFHGLGDIYYLFYECGKKLLKRNEGHLIYITSNKYMRGVSGSTLRTFLRSQTTIKTIIDFGELPVFDAKTDPAILFIKNEQTADHLQFRVVTIKEKKDIGNIGEAMNKNGFPMRVSNLSDDGWSLMPENIFSLLDKIKHSGISLDRYSYGKMHRGIYTGMNDAFVIEEEAKKQQLIEDAPSSAELIKSCLWGREIQRWLVERKGKYIIYTTKRTDIDKYPAIKKHLCKYKAELKNRALPGEHYWYALQAPTTINFAEPKIVYNETSTELRASIDKGGLYVYQNVSVIFSEHKEYILGIMNSDLMDFYYRWVFPALGDPWNPKNRGRIRFLAEGMKKIPIIEASETQREAIAERVRKILAAPASPQVQELEAQINELVYNLYALTQDEIAIVKEWQAKRKGTS